MPPKKEDDMLGKFKLTILNWVVPALLSIVLWLVKDMHGDLKSVMRVIPVMQKQIDYLEDGQLNLRFKVIPPAPSPAKHEDPITYDSLISK